MIGSRDLQIRLATNLKVLPNYQKITLAVVVDAVLLMACVLFAYVLRISDFELPSTSALSHYFLAPVLSIFSLTMFDVYRNSFRSFTLALERRLLLSQFIVAPVWAAILQVMGIRDFSRSVIIIYILIATLALDFLRRLTARILAGSPVTSASGRIPIVIVGAGQEGVALAAALERQGVYHVAAFLDTDYTWLAARLLG
jgi:FlaA1/EpsC-like NDP-sugar epimerase